MIADNAGSFFTSAPSQQTDAQGGGGRGLQFDITVSDPVKQGEGVSAFVAYRVLTKTTHPAYSRPTSEVRRRYSHFSWLHQQLAEKHKGCIVPPLPEKSAVQKFQMSTEFIDARRRALQVRCCVVARHHGGRRDGLRRPMQHACVAPSDTHTEETGAHCSGPTKRRPAARLRTYRRCS